MRHDEEKENISIKTKRADKCQKSRIFKKLRNIAELPSVRSMF